ncbi:MAG: glycosyl hydrolase 53 family protein [Lachnospiraceae bacterium]|nr:glycosyl hydrolase 53 family protein [Lachnospiraceae bacterium]
MKKKRIIAICLITMMTIGCGGGNSAASSVSDTNTLSEAKEGNENVEKIVSNPVTCKFADSPAETDIFVDKIEGIADDFYCGVDISSLLAEEASGVEYYDKDGKKEDLFKLLSDGGVNYIRVRVWNDPFDADGHGYGGGNCTAETAAELGKRAAEYGMKLYVDFHYSDFWADPGKQMVPKAWKGLDIHDKADKAYEFTIESMKTILDAGADVGLVSLGNEITGGLSGEKQVSFMALIMNGGAKAVREISEERGLDISLIAHLTNPENPDGILDRVNKFKTNEVDYDILALSYYPFWHGSLENLTSLMKKIKADYGKDVLVAETSYMFTTADGDGTGNSVSTKDLQKDYAATAQSQVNSVRDVCEAVVNAGGLGVFYWEPAWIPVNHYDPSKQGAGEILEANKKAWEELGSGWATSYAGSYDPNDAGRYYGGSSWDNQAWFDFDGRALPSLFTYKYLKNGATAPLSVDFADDAEVNITPGSELKMPETCMAHFNDRSKNGEAKVIWDQADLDKVNLSKQGEYTVNGSFEDGYPARCIVKVESVNLLQNGSFEDSDRSMYVIDGNCGDYQQKESDAKTGEWAMHYWSSNEVGFVATQTIEAPEDGTYAFSLYAQGGDSGASPKMNIFVQVGDAVKKTDFSVDGWINWKNPKVTGVKASKGEKITVGVSINAGAGAWGTLDDWYLYRVE